MRPSDYVETKMSKWCEKQNKTATVEQISYMRILFLIEYLDSLYERGILGK